MFSKALNRASFRALRNRASIDLKNNRRYLTYQRLSKNEYSPFLFATSLTIAGVGYQLLDNPSEAAAAPKIDYENVKKDIADLIEESSSKRGDGTSIGPTFVRLAWHTSGTYCKNTKTGGSNGATMRYEPEKSWGANAGLEISRNALEGIKQKYPQISYADLWTLAGSVAIQEMGGPVIKWRPGRSDSDKPTSVPDGRLPDADKGEIRNTINHVREIFSRMGFSDREMVALIGAHAVGRCHPEASGYWGPWTFAETTFSNEYFRLLVEGGPWTVKTTHNGAPWTGPTQFEDPSGAIMMLPSDMAMIWDKRFHAIVEEFAKNEDAFFKEFSTAWTKLIELGVNFKKSSNGGILAWFMSLFGF
mmetsp:Transcript_7335/g.10941  ORF Transcript_7335/g.10941 Transcript_7335/m.10941 type:complete len:361 (+) Transcript_7335:47-1129(+)